MNKEKIKKSASKTYTRDNKEQNSGNLLKSHDEKLLLLKKALGKSSDAIRISDFLGNHFYQNKSFTELFKYNEEELKSLDGWRSLYADKNIGNTILDTIIAAGSWIGEVELVSKGGNIFVGLQRVEAIRNDNGNVVGIIGFHKDITEFKTMEEELHEHDKRFKRLFQCAPGMIYQFTRKPGGTYFVPFVTDAIRTLYGCSPEDVRDDISPIISVILPEDLNKFLDSIEYSARHMTNWTCEYRIQFPGKPIQWRLGNSIPEKLSDGSITWYGFNTDITAGKLAEEAIRENEEKYRSLFDHSRDAILLTKPDGTILDANPAACKMLGRSADDIKKIGRDGLVDIEDPRLQIAMKKRELSGGETAEFNMLRANGKKFPVEVSSKVFCDAKGEKKTSMIIRDITQRKRNEDSLKRSEEDLYIKSQKLEEMNTALKVLLRQRDEDKTQIEENILTNVKTSIFPLIEKLRKSPLNHQQKTYLKIIEEKTKKIILPFLRNISRPSFNLTPQELRVADLVRSGHTTKEIADILKISIRTVDCHRENLRSKLGIKNSQTNLRSFLMEF